MIWHKLQGLYFIWNFDWPCHVMRLCRCINVQQCIFILHLLLEHPKICRSETSECMYVFSNISYNHTIVASSFPMFWPMFLYDFPILCYPWSTFLLTCYWHVINIMLVHGLFRLFLIFQFRSFVVVFFVLVM